MFLDVVEWENFTKKNFLTRYLHKNKYKTIIKILENNKTDKITILDLGCGFADTFKFLNKILDVDYTGFEKNIKIFEITKDRYKNFNNFKIVNQDVTSLKDFNHMNFDIIIMFDLLEHIKLPNRFKLLEIVSNINFKKLLINVPNEVGFAIFIKNIGSKLMRYDRDWEYSNHDTFNSIFRKIEKMPPHEDTHKGFDWYVLKYLLHYHFKIKKIHTLFNSKIPKFISPSIFFECEKRQT